MAVAHHRYRKIRALLKALAENTPGFLSLVEVTETSEEGGVARPLETLLLQRPPRPINRQPVVAHQQIRPDLFAGSGLDQLGANSNAIARFADAAVEDIGHAQLLSRPV